MSSVQYKITRHQENLTYHPGQEIREMMEFADKNFDTFVKNITNMLKGPIYPRSSKNPT